MRSFGLLYSPRPRSALLLHKLKGCNGVDMFSSKLRTACLPSSAQLIPFDLLDLQVWCKPPFGVWCWASVGRELVHSLGCS